ncbi:hypothetical protein M0802_007833 [Mischocyttarus mexicanus]|nr:hypothetical protein M0802_007833 [Mischocyttarus mexicanus]
MKIVFLILTTIFISCHGFVYNYTKAEESNPDTYTAIAVDKFREIMKTGNSTLGIPVLDPFKLHQLAYKLEEEGFIEARGYLRNLRVDKLSTFKALKADFNLIGVKTNLHLVWDSIKLVTNYSVTGTLGNLLSIYGLGDIDATAKGLDVEVTMGLSVRDGNLYVKSFESKIKLEALDIKITGLFFDEEISETISSVLSDMVPQLIDDYQKELTGKLNSLATSSINVLLKGKTIGDLISIIG